MRATHRRICWPDPGPVCLQGGCGYCNESPFRSLTEIEDALTTEELWIAYRDGRANDFWNAQTRSKK